MPIFKAETNTRMKLYEITNALEKIAPLSFQESYDNSGLIVGSSTAEINKVLVCLDSIEEIVDEAIEKNCQLVIAHHPIVFSGLKKLNGNNYIERTIIKAIKNDIAIYAIHTNLDNVLYQGVNQKIAEVIGLSNCKILSPKSNQMSKLVVYAPTKNAEEVRKNLFRHGAGKISDYSECSFNSSGIGTYRPGDETNPAIGKKGETNQVDETKIEVIVFNHLKSKVLNEVRKIHPYEEVAYELIPISNSNSQVGAGMIGELEDEMETVEFLKSLKKRLKTECIRHTKIAKPTVKKVALCGGSGSFLLNEAIRQEADVFLTGDYKYHQFFDAENKVVIADVGHYESEQFTINLLEEILTNKFKNLHVIKTTLNTNPVNYL